MRAFAGIVGTNFGLRFVVQQRRISHLNDTVLINRKRCSIAAQAFVAEIVPVDVGRHNLANNGFAGADRVDTAKGIVGQRCVGGIGRTGFGEEARELWNVVTKVGIEVQIRRLSYRAHFRIAHKASKVRR